MRIKEYTVVRWTQSAVDCYSRNCICKDCPTYELIGDSCQMKNTVRLLVQKFGKPPEIPKGIFPGMTFPEVQITNAILKGCKTTAEIADEIGFAKGSVNGYLSGLYVLCELDGYKFKKGNEKFEEFVQYIQDKFSTKEDKKGEKNMFDQDLNLEYPNFLEKLVDALKKGYTEYGELEDETDIRRGTLSVYFDNLFKLLAERNLVDTNSKQSRRLSVIEFIQTRLCDQHQKQKDLDLKIKRNQFGIGEPRKVEIKTPDKIIEEKKTKKEEPKLNLAKRIEEHKKQQKESSLLNEPYTIQEERIVGLLMEGLNYEKIAEDLCLSITTVKSHINNIFQKRDYHSLQELIVAEYKKEVTELKEYIKGNTHIGIAVEPKIDFTTIKVRIQKEINKLNEKLKAVDLLEEELKGLL